MWKVYYDHTEKKKVNIRSRNFNQEQWGKLPKEEKTFFKLYDDDGNLYYDGFTSDINESEEKAFAPLDWAMAYAGCTTMKYKDRNGQWQFL